MEPTAMIGATVLIAAHASEVMRQRQITQHELLEALGPHLVDGDRLRAHRAYEAEGVAPGRPALLGWQPGPPGSDVRRDVLLARTRRARFLIVVVALECGALVVITAWDQDAELHRWQPDRLSPTELGRRSLPPTYWCTTHRWDTSAR